MWSYARFAVTLVPGLAVLAVLPFALVAVDPLQEGELGITLGLMVILGLGTLGLGLVGFAIKHVRLALKLRPCDVLVGPRGLHIEGGRHRGPEIAWGELVPAGCAIAEEQVRRLTLAFILLRSLSLIVGVAMREEVNFAPAPVVRVWRLRIEVRGRGRFVLAEAESELERDSLQALLACIRAMCAGPSDTPPAHDHDVLACPSCGAPAPAADAACVACAYCATPVEVPADVRERVRASEQTRASERQTNRRVQQLLDQPGAHATNLTYALAAVPMALAWPAVVAVAVVQARAGVMSFTSVAPLVVFPLAIVLGSFTLLRARLVNRIALRLLTLGFAAREPGRPGAPHLCRRCGGALVTHPHEVVARCIFCRADNILGLDLRGEATVRVDEAQGLAAALRHRARERAIWFALAPVALALVAAGAWILLRAPGL